MTKNNLYLLFLFFSLQLNAQEGIPVKIGLVTQQIGLPDFKSHGGNFGFGGSTETYFLWTQKRKWRLTQSVNLMFTSQEKNGSLTMLNTSFGVNYTFFNRINARFSIGPGYGLLKNYNRLYTYENGAFVKSSAFKHQYMMNSSFSLSVRLKKIEPYFSYGLSVNGPFLNSIKLLPRQFFEAGIYIHLIKRNHE